MRYRLTEIHPEIASHSVGERMYAVRLHGGPWDGREGARDPHASRTGRVKGWWGDKAVAQSFGSCLPSTVLTPSRLTTPTT
jgi:hypothetical protein